MPPKKLKDLPVHPFLFAIASVLSLLSVNKTEVQPWVAIRLILVMLLVTLISYFLLYWIFRNRDKAALLTTVILILFTTYGSLFSLLQKVESLSSFLRHRYMLGMYLGLLLISIFFIARAKKPEKMTWPLNLVLGIALAIPLLQVIFFYATNSSTSPAQVFEDKSINQDVVLTGDEKPDIYYIILDSYVREDALLDLYDFDNSGFLQELRNRGFFVGDCSRSNYAHTRLSLSSSLNMNYLDALGVNFDPDTRNIRDLDHLIRKSSVNRVLRDFGYQTVAFETGYIFTELKDADHYYESNTNLLFSSFIEPFEYLFVENSIFKVVIDTESGFLYRAFSALYFPFTEQETRVRNIFKTLPNIPDIAGPKFVFVHLEIPHHPFIFLPDGSINPDHRFYPGIYMPENTKLMGEGYINQVKYVNAEILTIIDEIQNNSAVPPVIILQGDHGLQGGDRMNILNAISIPNAGEETFYASISPVNTFRAVLNETFGTDLPYLEDISYMSYSEDKMELTIREENYDHCKISFTNPKACEKDKPCQVP